jgi:hypothetical protein
MSADWMNTDLLFRQIHPNHWDGKNPNSVAFSPTPKDADKLSVDDAAQVTAEYSWRHFTQNLGFMSAGTWAVSVAEIESAGDLDLYRAPLIDLDDVSKNNPAHCLIDFSRLTSKGQKKRRAQELAIKASVRGCQFQSPI